LQPKIHQISFGGWGPPRPTGGAYSAHPDPLAGFRGPTCYFYGERGKAGRGRGGNRGWVGEGGG